METVFSLSFKKFDYFVDENPCYWYYNVGKHTSHLAIILALTGKIIYWPTKPISFPIIQINVSFYGAKRMSCALYFT